MIHCDIIDGGIKMIGQGPIRSTRYARSVADSPHPLSIGRGTFDKVRGFVGAIDELAIFTRVLGEDEIADLYQAGACGMRLAK